MHDFGSTVLCCTPSYALYLADAIKDSGLPREEFRLKIGAFGAEPWTENMRNEIEEKLGIEKGKGEIIFEQALLILSTMEGKMFL